MGNLDVAQELNVNWNAILDRSQEGSLMRFPNATGWQLVIVMTVIRWSIRSEKS